MAGWLINGYRQLQLAAGDLREQFIALGGIAELGDQTASKDHRVQVGFQAQSATQFGHDQ
ncbi:hypothetical protein D3C80_2185510 [compost metagenome]